MESSASRSGELAECQLVNESDLSTIEFLSEMRKDLLADWNNESFGITGRLDSMSRGGYNRVRSRSLLRM